MRNTSRLVGHTFPTGFSWCHSFGKRGMGDDFCVKQSHGMDIIICVEVPRPCLLSKDN